MPAKKSESKAKTSTTVQVSVPAQPGISVKDIENAAATFARDEIPIEIPVTACKYELAAGDKKDGQRNYTVTISWGDDVVSPDLDVNDDDDAKVKAIVSPSGPLENPNA